MTFPIDIPGRPPLRKPVEGSNEPENSGALTEAETWKGEHLIPTKGLKRMANGSLQFKGCIK